MNKAERLMTINKHDYYRENKNIAAEKVPLLRELLGSIVKKEFLVYLQPKLHVKTGQIDSAEVLVRYREKDGSIVSPFKFVPLLESERLISYIDFFVMEEACRLLTKWKNTSLSDMKLALNFSGITLFDDHFFENFCKIFGKYDLKPDQLELEITETQETLNKKQMAYLLKQLKNYGFCIALDDFGVEYSSYIQKYQKSDKGDILVKHIIQMSHAIGIQCCAEGVETEEHFAIIRIYNMNKVGFEQERDRLIEGEGYDRSENRAAVRRRQCGAEQASGKESRIL